MEINDSFCINVMVMFSGCFFKKKHYQYCINSLTITLKSYTLKNITVITVHLSYNISDARRFFSTTIQMISTSGCLSLLLTVTKEDIYVKKTCLFKGTQLATKFSELSILVKSLIVRLRTRYLLCKSEYSN